VPPRLVVKVPPVQARQQQEAKARQVVIQERLKRCYEYAREVIIVRHVFLQIMKAK